MRLLAIALLYFLGWVTITGDAEALTARKVIQPTACQSVSAEMAMLTEIRAQFIFLQGDELRRAVADSQGQWTTAILIILLDGRPAMAFGNLDQVCLRIILPPDMAQEVWRVIRGETT